MVEVLHRRLMIRSCQGEEKVHKLPSGVENFIQSLSSFLISLVVTSRAYYRALLGFPGFKSEGENE